MFTAMEMSDNEPGSKWDWFMLAFFIVSMIVLAVVENA